MRKLVEWTINHHVTVGLLMILFVFGGCLGLFNLRKELRPNFTLNMIRISVNYPGATPDEIEESVIVKIEEKLVSITGIKEIRSTSAENNGFIICELENSVKNVQKVKSEIENAVDSVNTFPDDMEKPIIEELTLKENLLNIVIWGKTSEKILKETAEKIKDELLLEPEISQIDISGIKDYEIQIEISEEQLRKYRISFDNVINAVRLNSSDISAGKLYLGDKEYLIRFKGNKYTKKDFENIVILSSLSGTDIKLKDIAKIKDSFEEVETEIMYDKKKGVMLTVQKTESDDSLKIANVVYKFLNNKKYLLPENVDWKIWQDNSYFIKDRLNLLGKNAVQGLILVFLSLLFFLNSRISIWVTWGIPISFLGTFLLMSFFDITLNMITMFGLIVVLGMIVDDAIVVAENIYTHFTETGDVIKSTIEGTSEVTWPVISSVSTTMIAFAPLLFVPGTMGKFFQLLPVIVIIALGISTLECFIMLPAHLSNSLFKYKRKVKKNKVLQKIRDDLKQILIKINSGFYEPILRMSLKNRYITLSIILAMLFISLGLIKGGILKFTFFPKFDADFINITVELPQGTAKNITMHAVNQIIDEIPSLDKYYKDSVLISEKLVKGHLIHFEDSHKVNVMIELVSAEKRTVTSSEIEVQLRKFVKQIPEAVSVKFGLLKIGPGGKPIQIEIVSENLNELKIVSEKIKKELYKYDGLYDIDLNVRPGKEEIKFKLKPLAKQLNLDLYDVANQIRTAFYGATAVKIQRGKDDIDVKVKYPRNKRTSFSNLKELRIRTKTGVEVPLMQVAEYYIERGYSTIERKNRNRYIYVESNIDESKANAEEILQDIDKNYLPKLRSRHHNVKIRFGGSNENTNESVGSLIKSYPIAMLLIFAILATLFDSYFKPLIVMAAIPFGLIGAAMGHLIMGYDITLISLFGIVALSGIVVNDSLILIDFILRSKLRSQNLYEAVVQSGVRRFRPIILTSVTTIFGLAPMMFEKSTQAKFLIPMAISISYGLLFATVLTLVFIPSLYLIYNDVSRLIIKIFKRKHLTPEQTEVYYELH